MVESRREDRIGGQVVEGSKPDQYGRIIVKPGISSAEAEFDTRIKENAEARRVAQEAEIGKGAVSPVKQPLQKRLFRGLAGLIGR